MAHAERDPCDSKSRLCRLVLPPVRDDWIKWELIPYDLKSLVYWKDRPSIEVTEMSGGQQISTRYYLTTTGALIDFGPTEQNLA